MAVPEFGYAAEYGRVRPVIGYELPGLASVQQNIEREARIMTGPSAAIDARLAMHEVPFVTVVGWTTLRQSPLFDEVDTRDKEAVWAITEGVTDRVNRPLAEAHGALDVVRFGVEDWTGRSGAMTFTTRTDKANKTLFDDREAEILNELELEEPSEPSDEDEEPAEPVVIDERTCVLALVQNGVVRGQLQRRADELNGTLPSSESMRGLPVKSLTVGWQVYRPNRWGPRPNRP